MATIVTRIGKGSALTYQEADDNWTGLNTEVAGKQPLSAVLTATTASYTTAEQSKLAGISGTNTGDETAAGILAKLLTVDGAGSGLDADLLDGLSSAAFATAAQGALAASASQPGHTHAQADVTGLVTALAAKAPLASPTFTGTVTLPAGQVVNGVTLTTGGGTTNFLRADGTYAAPSGGGGGNAVAAPLAFGGTFTDKAQTVVTGQTWVASNSKIALDVLTPSGTDPDEMYLLNFRPVVSDLVAGVGFTVTLYSEAQARGTYTVNCIGV